MRSKFSFRDQIIMQGLKTNMSWLLPWVLVLCFVLLSCSDLSDANHTATFLCNILLLPFYSSIIYSIPPKNNFQAFQIWFTLSFKWVSESHSVMSDSLQPHRPYSPWNSPDQNTGVGSLFLLQGIFPTQGSNQISCIASGFFTIWATREGPWN